MNNRRIVFVLIVLAVLGGLIAFLLGSNGRPGSPTPPRGEVEMWDSPVPPPLPRDLAENGPAEAGEPAEPAATNHAEAERAPLVVLRGRVVDAEGKPIERATVYVIPKDREERAARGDPTHVDLGGGGEFRIGVESTKGTWVCVAPPAQSGLLHAFLDGDKLGAGKPLELVMERAPVREIVVTDLEDRPLDNVRLGVIPSLPEKIVTWPGPGEPTMGSWGIPMGSPSRVETAFPWDGPLKVTASLPGYGAATAILGAGENYLHLRLGPSATIRIKVEGVSDPKVPISVSCASLTTGSRDRSFEFTGHLGPGEHIVKVYAVGYETVELSVVVREHGEVIEQVVRLGPRSGVGDLRVRMGGSVPEELPFIWVLWRRADLAGSEWKKHVGIVNPEKELVWREREVGLYDLLLLTMDGAAGCTLTRVPVQEGEAHVQQARLAPTFKATMPKSEFAGRKVVGAELHAPPHPTLPLYRLTPNTLNLNGSGLLPEAGTSLGPFLVKEATLRIALEDGTTRELRIPAE